MTLIEAHEVEPDTPLVDLEDQTTPITGTDLPRRVTVVEAVPGHLGTVVTLGSATALSIDVWAAVKHEPLSLGGLRRRDHAFAWPTQVTVVHYFDPEGTPAVVLDDIDLVRFETRHDIAFGTTLNHWRNLLLGHVIGKFQAAQDEAEPPTPPAAWTAFEELGEWLNYSDRETARLLGLGDKTAYGWRREGRPPQPRLARRVYEANAFVRQLVAALGAREARRVLAQGGDDSALALIEANRVAEAEARFADLIYSRPTAGSPIGASRSGDEDLPAGPSPERLPGGRRRVQARRGR
jgi:hypothetical protein